MGLGRADFRFVLASLCVDANTCGRVLNIASQSVNPQLLVFESQFRDNFGAVKPGRGIE